MLYNELWGAKPIQIFPWVSGQLLIYNHIYILSLVIESQAARQGLAVLLVSAVVVLKHDTSILCQSHNFISIDFKFGVGDYVREVTSPAKVVWIQWAVETPRGGNVYGSYAFFAFFILQQPIPVNQSSHTIAQKTRSGVRKTLFGMINV